MRMTRNERTKGEKRARPALSVRRRGGGRLWRVVQMVGALVLGIGAATTLWAASSGAAGPAAGSVLNGAVTCAETCTANTPYSSGQAVTITVPASSTLAAFSGSTDQIEECQFFGTSQTPPAGGFPASDFPNGPNASGECDALTLGGSVSVNADGSFTDTVPIYALPDPNFESTSPITCDLGTLCVLYLGTNASNPNGAQNFWSQPFYVNPNGGSDAGNNPGDGSAPPTQSVSPTTSTVVASNASAVANGVSQSTVTVTLLSSSSLPVQNKLVTLGQGSGHSVINPVAGVITNSTGQAVFTVTDTTGESVTYTATDTTDPVTIAQTVTVAFAAQAVSAAHSMASANPTGVLADGTTASVITVTVLDQASPAQPISGVTVSITPSSGTSSVITAVSATTGANGQATFKVTDATAQTVVYTASASAVTITQTATVGFGSSGSVSPTQSTVTATSPAVTGGAGSQVTVTLLSSSGVPVPNKMVSLTLSGSAQATPSSATANSSGVATFTVTDSASQQVSVTATDTSDSVVLTATATIVFEGAPSATTSTVTASAPTVPADGETTATIIVVIKDASNTALSGQSVQLSSSSTTATITPIIFGSTPPSTTDSTGTAEYKVNDEVAESVTFTASVPSSSVTVTQTASVTFTPGAADPQQSTIGANPTNPPSDGTTASTVTVTLKDHFSNVVPGVVVTLVASGGSSVISPKPPQATTDSSGKATFTVTDAVAEVVTYTPSVGGTALTGVAVAVTFGTPPAPPAAIADSTIVDSASSAPADGTTAVTVMVLLSDKNGVPVAGKAVSLNPSGGSSTVTAVSATTNSSGQASFTVTDKTVESITYTATDTTDSESITGQSVTISFVAPAGGTGTTTTTTTTTTTNPSTTSDNSGSGTTGSGSTGSTDSGTSGSTLGTSTTGSSSDASSPSLAFTGASTELRWFIVVGALMLIAGSVGRVLTRRLEPSPQGGGR